MTASPDSELSDLVSGVQAALKLFVEAAQKAFGKDLETIVLYGSAAEGRLRRSSDVNVLVLLSRFEPASAAALAEAFEAARAAVKLRAMFLLRSELEPAVEAFAQKFADIRRRHRVLFGGNPFESVAVPRAAEIFRLQQVLLNLALRLREAYIGQAKDDPRLTNSIATAAGPLRSCAATLLELEGQAAPSPREALDVMARDLSADGGAVLANVSRAREMEELPPGEAGRTLLDLIQIAEKMRARASRLK
jgi:predicted nucleotidyltransferase